jgi:hypothetical protein
MLQPCIATPIWPPLFVDRGMDRETDMASPIYILFMYFIQRKHKNHDHVYKSREISKITLYTRRFLVAVQELRFLPNSLFYMALLRSPFLPSHIGLARALPRPTYFYIYHNFSARRLFITLMIEAISSSETSVNIHQTTQCYIPEESHLHTHCH